jgi:hypothetical protein
MYLTNEAVEIDVQDGRYADPAYWLSEDAPSIVLRLSDPQAGDATYPSDARLELNQYGKFTGLGAYMSNHCVGLLWNEAEIRDFFERCRAQTEAADGAGNRLPTRIELYDIDKGPDTRLSDRNGVQVEVGRDSVTLRCGHHIFGRATGPQVGEFFRRAWLRATLQPEEKRAVVAD